MKIEISLMEFRQNSSDKALADLVRTRVGAISDEEERLEAERRSDVEFAARLDAAHGQQEASYVALRDLVESSKTSGEIAAVAAQGYGWMLEIKKRRSGDEENLAAHGTSH